MKPRLITSYVDPDLDGVASMVAYVEFLRTQGVDATCGIIGEAQVEAEYLMQRFGIESPEVIPNADAYDEVVLVDASRPSDLEGTIAAEKVIEIVDHRSTHEAGSFPNAAAHIEYVGAAATLIAEKYMEHSVEPSRESAILLCGGIISNTLNFKSGSTTDRDRQAFDWLNRVAKLTEDFWRELFVAKSDLSGDKLAERLRDDYKGYALGDGQIGIAALEIIGVRELLARRSDEVVRLLGDMKKEEGVDYLYLNAVELETPQTFLVTDDRPTQELLQVALHARFEGVVAELPNAMTRKRIVPLLREAVR